MKLPVKVVGVTDLHIVPVDNEVSINTERIPCLQLDLKDENKGSQLNLKSLLHPEYSQDILSLCIQHSPPGQAIKYNVIKSELVSNDEDLSVAFVDSSSQKASKGVRRHVSGTKSRDLSDNFFQVDKQSLVIEEKVNAEQISDPNSPSLIDEKAGNEVIIVQQTYFSKKLKTGVENKFCDMTEKQGFEENVELHPIGLYQNVHVASSDKRKLQLHMRCPLNSTKEKLSRRKKSVNKIRSSRTFITAKFSNSDNITAVEMDSCQKDEAASVSEQTSQEANEWNSTGVLKDTEESNTPVKRKTKSSAELSKSSPKTKKGSKYSKVYQCLMCNSTFTCAASRRIHMRLHTGEKPYVCGDCDTAFLDHSAFRRHKRIHSGSKPYTCPECGECFARSFTLTVHQRRHSGEKPYQCQHCGMSFSQSANLKKHIRVHTGDKPYQCDLCPASFAQGHALKCHRTIHKDDKPFMCQECGDIFSRPQYLQKHMKTHDHTKSFLCQYCPATFRMHESLRYHTESHLGNKIYQCEECMMTFQRKDRYKVHKFRTHRNVKYSCDMCEAVYNRSDHLKRHKAKIHPCGV